MGTIVSAARMIHEVMRIKAAYLKTTKVYSSIRLNSSVTRWVLQVPLLGSGKQTSTRRSLCPDPLHSEKYRQRRYASARQQARRHAQYQRKIPLISPMHNPHHLQHAEAAKSQQRNPHVALLPPHGHNLRHKQQRIAPQPQTENHRNNFFSSPASTDLIRLLLHPLIQAQAHPAPRL